MAIVVLVLNPEGGEGGYIQLESQSYLIGRAEGADIELDSASVSREHARISFSGNEWHLEDLGSRNGSSLNGKRISRAVLQEGDILGVGSDVAFFYTESTPEEMADLQQNFPRLKRMALRYSEELAVANKPLMAPSEKIPMTKTQNTSFASGKKPTLLSDIALGKIGKPKH